MPVNNCVAGAIIIHYFEIRNNYLDSADFQWFGLGRTTNN